MKRFLYAAVSLLLLSALSTAPANAQTRVEQSIANYNAATIQPAPDLTPFDLATFAYRGYFKAQGINGYGSLTQDYASGKVTPKVLVQAAVDSQRLPASTLDDRAYLNALDNQLRELALH